MLGGYLWKSLPENKQVKLEPYRPAISKYILLIKKSQNTKNQQQNLISKCSWEANSYFHVHTVYAGEKEKETPFWPLPRLEILMIDTIHHGVKVLVERLNLFLPAAKRNTRCSASEWESKNKQHEKYIQNSVYFVETFSKLKSNCAALFSFSVSVRLHRANLDNCSYNKGTVN